MSLTRQQVEQETIERLRGLLGQAGISTGTTTPNAGLTQPLRWALGVLAVTPAGLLAVVDADVAQVVDADAPALLDLMELGVLRRVKALLARPVTETRVGQRTIRYADGAGNLDALIADKLAQVQQDYGLLSDTAAVVAESSVAANVAVW